jgi:putative transposase
MPRFARVVVPQCPHHVTQRGNERRDVFFTTGDRDVYLGLLKQYSAFHGVQVLGFCLMTNHVHLVVLPDRAEGLAKLLREVQMRYSQYRHAVERGNGHLWQGRYYSCPVDPERLSSVMRYVELNPVRAGLVDRAGAYPWSSAMAHLGAADPWNLVALTEWNRCWTAKEWADILLDGAEEGGAIREATYGGRPLGPQEFVARLEAYLERPLRRGSPGRPKKELAHLVQTG